MANCTICRRADVAAINESYIRGCSIRTICTTFRLSLGTAQRHKRCIRTALSQARTERVIERSELANENLLLAKRLLRRTFAVMSTARKRNELRNENAAISNATRLLEMLLRVDGTLQSGAGALHLHKHESAPAIDEQEQVDEIELAEIVARETGNFAPERIERLKQLAERSAARFPALPGAPIAAKFGDSSGTATHNT